MLVPWRVDDDMVFFSTGLPGGTRNSIEELDGVSFNGKGEEL